MSEPVMLTVAGSDPSGGAGIQADLKTATALGVYGASVLTAVTVQNTTGVQGVHALPTDVVVAQLRSVLDDLDVRAVKIGMLGDATLVAALADVLRPLDVPIVLDPVMVATSGDVLVPRTAVRSIIEHLVPLAAVVTPNVPEAHLITEVEVGDVPDLERAGQAMLDLGAHAALVKGGHLAGAESTDALVEPGGVTWLSHPRIETANTHGTGCTLSSGVAAGLADGASLRDAVVRARDFLHRALESGAHRRYGAGHGPVDHLVDVRR